MTRLKRPLASAGAATLLALALTACGGGAPSDASVDDYCDAVQNTTNQEDFFKAVEDEDWDKLADLIEDQAKELEEVGTPDDISDEEREGFEIQLDAAKGISSDDLEKAFKDDEDPFEAEISKDDKDKVEAYNEYQNETCSDAGSDGGETGTEGSDSVETPEVPTDLPTDLPSELSDLPSDLPDPEELESLLSELPELPSDLGTE